MISVRKAKCCFRRTFFSNLAILIQAKQIEKKLLRNPLIFQKHYLEKLPITVINLSISKNFVIFAIKIRSIPMPGATV
jgi:hypothetical protein